MITTTDVFDELEAKLANHSELQWQKSDTSLHINAVGTEGFSVTLSKTGGGWLVELGDNGFHEEFGPADDPLEFVSWCYSGQCRLREIRYGSSVGRIVLERLEGGQWGHASTTGFIFFPFWKKRSTRLFQNPNLLRPI